MFSFYIICIVFLATYTVNADNSVLDNDGKPVVPSGLQNSQSIFGKNNVVGDLKTNNNLEEIQTTPKGLGNNINRYENSMTDNFQNIPQQNNRTNNNYKPNRRNRRRNNRNKNKGYSQSYGFSSPPSPPPSHVNSDWNNYWDNFQPVVASPPPPPPPSPFSSEWNTYWDNFQPVMMQPITYPPPPPQFNRFSYKNNNNMDNYNNGNFGYSNGHNFQPDMTPPIPYPPPQNNGFNYNYNNNNNGNFDYGNGLDLSNGPDIIMNDDDIVGNGQKNPMKSSTQGASITFNDNNELIVNGQKVPADAYSSVDIHGSNFGNKNSGNIKEDDMAINRKYGCILYKGFNFTDNGCYYDGSPNISLYDGGVVINGKKIPMVIGSRYTSPVVKFNEKDGFTVNGKKVPADPEGNTLKPSDVDGSGNTSGDRVPSKSSIGNVNSTNENSL